MKYLVIFEDFSTAVIEKITDDDKESVDAGALDIFKFEDGTFWNWYQDEWHEVNGVR